MLYNYLKVAIRNIQRHPGYSTLNLAGLALGITCCLLIYGYVDNELNFDHFHQNFKQLYRVNFTFHSPDITVSSPATPNFVGPMLKRKFPEVADQTRFLPAYSEKIIREGDKVYDESNVIFADTSFFRVFSFPLVRGNIQHVLERPETVVLSESLAWKYFGGEDPIGKLLILNQHDSLEVTGVCRDVPSNSTFQFDIAVSYATLHEGPSEHFNNPNYATYVVLQPEASVRQLQSKINEAIDQTAGQTATSEYRVSLELESMHEIHYNTQISNYNNLLRVADRRYINSFAIIAVLILLIASINYVNLSTAKAMERAREVGMRKVSGAAFRQVFGQFMGESIVNIAIAMGVAIVVFGLVRPLIPALLHISMPEHPHHPVLILGASGLALALLAGVYPALVLTRFRPVEVLKGKFSASFRGVRMRKMLVVVQFSVSIALIICTVVIRQQLQYMKDAKLGYDKAHLLSIPLDQNLRDKLPAFTASLSGLADVQNVAPVSRTLSKVVTGNSLFIDNDTKTMYSVGSINTDQRFLATMGMELKTGRNLDPTPTEANVVAQHQFLVNETFLKKFNESEDDIIGKTLHLPYAGGPDNGVGTVVGIVRDFHTTSMHEKIEPVVLFSGANAYYSKLMVRLQPGSVSGQLKQLGDLYRQFTTESPFEYEFANDEYNNLYKVEERISALANGFSFLAILISCLGLLGLSSYAVVQKRKEISIRKVFGATVSNIALLLTRNFLWLVVIGFAVSVPIAWYTTQFWLSDFAYRITPGAAIFLWTGFGAIGMAFVTISYQAITAAFTNPAEVLKSE